MRYTLAGVATALIMLGAGAAPALACGGYACAPCAAPCGYGVVYSGYGYHYIDVERLPVVPVPRWQAAPLYYYVNQGPIYTGPGAYAPLPVYQERAVRGRHGVGYGYSFDSAYRYRGGPYAHAMHHFYAGAPAWHGPAIYSYRPGVRSDRRAPRYAAARRGPRAHAVHRHHDRHHHARHHRRGPHRH